MKTKKKLQLNDLNIESFVTDKSLIGGADKTGTTKRTSPCTPFTDDDMCPDSTTPRCTVGDMCTHPRDICNP